MKWLKGFNVRMLLELTLVIMVMSFLASLILSCAHKPYDPEYCKLECHPAKVRYVSFESGSPTCQCEFMEQPE